MDQPHDVRPGPPPLGTPVGDPPRQPREVTVDLPAASLPGDLGSTLGPPARGVVVFAHGSGSTRRSPRNRHVADQLRQAGYDTLLFDLLTSDEAAADARTGIHRFDIGLLSDRLAGAVDWIGGQLAGPSGAVPPVALFGASTGAAAALVAAARRPRQVAAVVSRGGRPDLAGPLLPAVRAPVLLIVGGADRQVLTLNTDAADRLTVPHELRVVPDAGHLFEEPGALDAVVSHAIDWLDRHLAPRPPDGDS